MLRPSSKSDRLQSTSSGLCKLCGPRLVHCLHTVEFVQLTGLTLHLIIPSSSISLNSSSLLSKWVANLIGFTVFAKWMATNDSVVTLRNSPLLTPQIWLAGPVYPKLCIREPRDPHDYNEFISSWVNIGALFGFNLVCFALTILVKKLRARWSKERRKRILLAGLCSMLFSFDHVCEVEMTVSGPTNPHACESQPQETEMHFHGCCKSALGFMVIGYGCSYCSV